MRILLVIAFGCGASSAAKPVPPTVVEMPPRPAVETQPETPVEPPTMAEQVEAERRKCDAGDQASCATYGAALMLGKGVAKDDVRGAEIVRRSCDAGNGGGCEMYARAFERGMGVAQDADEFRRYMHTACDFDSGGGCRSFALAFDNDDPKRIPFLEKACKLDDGIGCMALGAAYLNGNQGIAQDLVKAKLYLQRACDLDPAKLDTACQKAAEL